MAPLQQLQSKIYTALPDLKNEMELKPYKKGFLTLDSENSFSRFETKVDELIYLTFLNRKGERLKQPITLTDVLRWLYSLEMNAIDRTNRTIELLNLWNLEKYTIDEQSIELINFLNNLKQ